MLACRKIMRFYRLWIFTALPTLLTAVWASVALAAGVATGIYDCTSTSSSCFNPANAPASSHLTSGTPECTVDASFDVSCSSYVLGGVGHTNADVDLTASYSATIDCTNNGGNLVESHTSNFSASNSATATPSKNGQLSVPTRSVSPFSAPQVCPNPNWTPSIRTGTLVLKSFDYTLTFVGFSSPYIEITAP
jgi:hypothetical protein